MTTPLVSIIIPTFNRASLIGETLDSVLAQTYTNWECLIVDDGSTDDTKEVVEEYVKNDSRVQYYHRPKDRPKGANACRNYGFELSKGEFVIFFDSDDKMTINHVEVKVKTLLENNVDYVISKTKYFNSDIKDEFYTFTTDQISGHNYITQKVNWLTYDVALKSNIARQISFNETLQAGQEFNYFSKLTLLTVHAILIDEYLTLRRYHETSIRGLLNKNENDLLKSFFNAHWKTYLDTENLLEKKTKDYLITRCVNWYFAFKDYPKEFKFGFLKSVYKEFGLRKATFFVLAVLMNFFFKKGYAFSRKVVN